VRYKQAAFGFGWAVVQPLVLVAVFALFVHRSGLVSSGRIPYPVFVLSGLVPWTFLSSGVLTGSESLVGSSSLISKVYFPRLALPVAALLSWVPDLLVGLGLLGVLMAVEGEVPAATAVLLPAFVVLAFLVALGATLWASALNVAYRDVRYAVPFAIQFWLFATPAVYSAHRFSGLVAALVSANPATSAVDGFRWALLGAAPPSWTAVGVSLGVPGALVASGLRYFRRTERYFADVV